MRSKADETFVIVEIFCFNKSSSAFILNKYISSIVLFNSLVLTEKLPASKFNTNFYLNKYK